VLLLGALVLLFQLLAAARHHHDPAAKSPHCASCMLHAQPHAVPRQRARGSPANTAATFSSIICTLTTISL
jgi:hypothetical protein